jgi:hypothetical protein
MFLSYGRPPREMPLSKDNKRGMREKLADGVALGELPPQGTAPAYAWESVAAAIGINL